MVTKLQIDRLAERVEKIAARFGPAIEQRMIIVFEGKVEADENGDPIQPIRWITRYRDGQPIDEDGQPITYTTDYSEATGRVISFE